MDEESPHHLVIDSTNGHGRHKVPILFADRVGPYFDRLGEGKDNIEPKWSTQEIKFSNESRLLDVQINVAGDRSGTLGWNTFSLVARNVTRCSDEAEATLELGVNFDAPVVEVFKRLWSLEEADRG
ncbi:hypothetical protein V6N12_067911 [Hibiscus sabdariffa]|uniref:Uncharacterized protein n=1 Tax=Hibiscus sabdariffa TaxID=183260 RepID=A0ABR2FNE6_9ROSI